MKKVKSFNVGDKVFAKVKGYPPWPAIVEEDNGKKYRVKFYGTGEVGQVKKEDIFYYSENKEKFAKQLKRKDYNEAIEEIEKVIAAAGTDGNNSVEDQPPASKDVSDNNTSIPKVETKGRKRKRADSLKSNENTSTPKKTSGAKKNNKPEAEENSDKSAPVEADTECLIESTIETSSNDQSEYETNLENESPVKVVKEKDPVKVVKEKDSVKIVKEKDPVKVVKEKDPVKVVKEKESKKSKAVDIKVVSVEELKANIAYAEYVKKDPELYKQMSVSSRGYHQNEVLPIVGNKEESIIGIKLHSEWPLHFENEYECALYDESSAKRVLELKKGYNSKKLEETPELFIPDLKLTAEEIDALIKERFVIAREKELNFCKTERKLLDIDSKIKNCLGLDKAEPKKALEYLKQMKDIQIHEIMLKKHVHLVDMIKRLRKYVGNTQDWNLGKEELDEFKKDAKAVREMAEIVYRKMKECVKLPNRPEHFWDGFIELVNKFREQTKHLTEAEVYTLSEEPHSRFTFMQNHFGMNNKTDKSSEDQKENHVEKATPESIQPVPTSKDNSVEATEETASETPIDKNV